ncbi:MAG TPA: ABC transporter substrate-binding protein, partial [Alphaproteobacteria bacterium]|nr:ABC transporter substrate-binding protein [Alphaproteobacteria bacterium]
MARLGAGWRLIVGGLAAAALCVVLPEGTPAADAPRRIVSLNLCTDLLLLALAEPSRIAALSFLSTDPDLSYYAADARALPRIRGSAEEVVPLKPDLVLAEAHSARTTVALLRRLGYRVLDLPVAATLADVREEIRTLARVLGEEAKGAALIAAMDEGLARLAPGEAGAAPGALVYQANGYVPALPSLPDELLRAAGLRNVAPELGLAAGGRLTLEALLVADPDLLVLEEARADAASLADALLAHPAVRARLGTARLIRMPA